MNFTNFAKVKAFRNKQNILIAEVSTCKKMSNFSNTQDRKQAIKKRFKRKNASTNKVGNIL